MTYGIASIVSCILLPFFYLVGMSLLKRTIYRPIASDEGIQRDEQAERDKVKAIREQGVKKVFMIYAAVVLMLFGIAFLAEPVKKVHAALWPTATPTLTNTPIPTATRTPSNTPTASRTPTSTQPGDGAANFLTTVADVNTTGTPPATRTAFLPSGGSSGGNTVTIIQTRIVVQVQTQIVTVPQIHYVPITVIVTATNTPLPSPTPESPTETATYTVTPSATQTTTPTETPTP